MKLKYQKQWLYILSCSLLLTVGYFSVQGQTQKQKFLDSVPEHLRIGLIQRLKTFIEYQSNKQWEKQYELLSFRIIQDESREVYIKRNQNWYSNVVPDDLILDFTLSEIISRESDEDGWWTIYGCANLRQKNRFVNLKASVDAYQENGDWFFSPIGVVTPVDGKPKNCEFTKLSVEPVWLYNNNLPKKFGK